MQPDPAPIAFVRERLSLARDYGCVVREAGIACWGTVNAIAPALAPRLVMRVSDVVDVSAGAGGFCYVRQSGDVGCWDSTERGDSAHRTIEGLRAIRAVEVQGYNACVIDEEGAVGCFGRMDEEPEVLPVDLGGPVRQLAISTGAACAVREDSSLGCWTWEGNPRRLQGLTPTGIELDDVRHASLDGSTVCALEGDGSIVECVPLPGKGDRRARTQVELPWAAGRVTQYVGAFCAVAAGDDGELACWGRGRRGVLGLGPDIRKSGRPTRVLAGVHEAAMASGFGCALLEGERIGCWGANGGKQIPGGTGVDAAPPTDIALPAKAAELQTLGNTSCARLLDGQLHCWGEIHADVDEWPGDRRRRALGPPNTSTPVRLSAPGGDGFAIHVAHVCRRLRGTVTCGTADNVRRSLSSHDAASLNRLLGTDVVDLALAGQGARADLYAVHGRKRALTMIDSRGKAIPVVADGKPLTGVKQFGVHLEGGCARTSGGRVRCWGRWHDRTRLVHASPFVGEKTIATAEVPGLGQVVDIGVAREAACAVEKAGTVKCWGLDFFGSLGVATAKAPQRPADPLRRAELRVMRGNEHETPLAVPGIDDAVSVDTAATHTCAVMRDRRVQCWGLNYAGQLGDGTTRDRLTPGLVEGVENVASVAVGADHTCALRRDGTVVCWGANDRGQAGAEPRADHFTPVVTPLP